MPRRPDRLSQALNEWRAEAPCEGRLSEACRGRILDAVHSAAPAARPRPLAALFLPLRGWALAGALPVALLSLVLGYGLLPGHELGDGPDRAPTLHASRVGDEVVFEIANGDRPHRVYRSRRAADSAGAQPVAVSDGKFRDRLDAGGELVFYRID